MKTNIAYLFATLLVVSLLSCSDDSEPLMMQEEESAPMLDYQTVADAQRALRPSRSSQQADEEEPDKKGQKGRDHRDWFEAFNNAKIKDFEKDITQLDVGDLYAIDPDGVNPYIFKFYFPEEYQEYANQYEGKRVVVNLEYIMGWSSRLFIQELFRTDSFSLDDSFLVSRYGWDYAYYYGLNNMYCGYTIKYSFSGVSGSQRELHFDNLVIIKEWH